MSQASPYIIYSESTPNPAVMKFVSNKMLAKESREYLTVNETEKLTLMRKLFTFPFVKEIFISNNYISIKKHESVEWMDITNQLRILIQESLNNGILIYVSNKTKKSEKKSNKKKSQLIIQIEQILDKYIRPGIQMDGGDIELVSCEKGVLKVFLKGACSGCPSSQMTLKNGIESLLKDKLAEKITEVVAINH
ncbi:MAG: NifU family protein [Flavobacteriales bacterium TMED191]|nr:MAG: NifU family protein [Flavobacteriales bacterium TMED191]